MVNVPEIFRWLQKTHRFGQASSGTKTGMVKWRGGMDGKNTH